MKGFFTVIGILGSIAAAAVLAALFFFLGVTRGVELDPSKLSLENCPVVFLDGKGDEMRAAEREYAFEFPDHLPHAFVAVEDKRFYRHNGFDFRRVVKAAMKNIASFSFREGASTISQQLVKNTHLTGEKTLTRKLKEFKLTRALEKKYSKKSIMELYLNSIYFGHSAFGIVDAARFYFGKEVPDLLPAESAMLAALVKSPNRYSPFKNAEACLGRRNAVLKLMREQGYLNEADFEEALSVPLPSAPHPLPKANGYQALVWEELTELFPGARTGEALTVKTAYDPDLQKTLEDMRAESDLCMLVIDGETRAVKALHSTAGLPKRLPGSTIKPLLVYGPALEENLLSPATPILDQRADFAGYSPDDAGGASGKYMSVREALAKSVNIPAVKTLNALGVEKGVTYLEKMGLGVGREDYSLALALGGTREGYTLQALADGYAALANGGLFRPSGAILRVESGGKVLYERPRDGVRVFSEDVAFLVNDMLRTAATEGTAKKLRSLPFCIAAKTGTHEARTGNLDAYTIAYTTEDVVAVWMGNADNSPVQATGGGLPANFARAVLETLYKAHSPRAFRPPESVVRVSFDREEYETRHRILRSDPLAPLLSDPEDYFRACNVPREESTRFTRPTIQMPSISVKNGSVSIVLCQTQYYDYVIKRENRGRKTTIYSGPYREVICDNSVCAGESYLYTVLPLYKGKEGEAVVLPSVKIEGETPLPDDWWKETLKIRSARPSPSLPR